MSIIDRIKEIIPKKVIRAHRLKRIKKAWPTCEIYTDKVNLDGKVDFGNHVRIPASSEVWGGYWRLFLCR